MDESDSVTSSSPLKNLWTGLKDISRAFTEATNIGGVSKVFHSKTWLQKLVWAAFFIVFTYFTVKDTFMVFKEYYNWPVVTRIEVESRGNVSFPSVTVCNLNPVDCSALAKIKNDSENLFKMWNATKCNLSYIKLEKDLVDETHNENSVSMNNIWSVGRV